MTDSHSIAHITNPKGHDQALCSICQEIKEHKAMARQEQFERDCGILEDLRDHWTDADYPGLNTALIALHRAHEEHHDKN